MSYILDALNRSNAESVQDPKALLVQAQSASHSRLLPVLFAMLIAVNAGLGGWWLWQRQAIAPPDLAISPPPHTVPEAPVVAATPRRQVERPPASSPLMPVADPAPEPSSPIQLARTPTPSLAPGEELIAPAGTPRPTPIGALPRGIQEQIPALAFSSHIYAEDPAVRMVNINGTLYREGDTIARGVKLLEITEAGAVLSYLHYIFAIDVLEDWAL